MKLRFTKESEIKTYIESDDAIFHFTRKDTAIEHILNTGILRFGLLGMTNDPQEYSSRMITPSGWGDLKKYREEISEITKTIEGMIQSSGLLSFCQNSYDGTGIQETGCLKSRMWSQYGENHSGICLVFSKQKLLEKADQELSEELIIYKEPVTYIDPFENRGGIGLSINESELAEQKNDEIINNYMERTHKKIFFQKQPDYKDENEFRIIAVNKNRNLANSSSLDISDSLRVIILGDVFPKVYLPTIKKLSETLGVPYRKLHWHQHSYNLLQWSK